MITRRLLLMGLLQPFNLSGRHPERCCPVCQAVPEEVRFVLAHLDVYFCEKCGNLFGMERNA